MTCGFEHSDGAYVLGSLSAADRRDFERHLTACPACEARVRQLAGLPGLLGRVGPDVLDEPAAPALPDTVLPSLLSAVRRSQRRRAWLTSAVAAAVTALVVGIGATVVLDTPATTGPRASQGSSQPMAPVGDVPIEASLTLESVTWGTRIALACTYDPSSVEYEPPPSAVYLLVVRTHTGTTEQVGTWRSVGGRTMRLEAATATEAEDIASVEVRTTDGRVVLTSQEQ